MTFTGLPPSGVVLEILRILREEGKDVPVNVDEVFQYLTESKRMPWASRIDFDIEIDDDSRPLKAFALIEHRGKDFTGKDYDTIQINVNGAYALTKMEVALKAGFEHSAAILYGLSELAARRVHEVTLHPRKNRLAFDKETERRHKVAERKIWGAKIESVERKRKQPVARSIVLRLTSLYQFVENFQKKLKPTKPIVTKMSLKTGVTPSKIHVPSNTEEQINFLIRKYNEIVEDIQHQFKKKDSYVKKLETFKELEKPTADDVEKSLYMMGANIQQIIFYMARWIEE